MIYQLTIPNFGNLKDDLIEKVRDSVEGICQWGYGRSPTNALELVSEKVNKSTLDKITEALIQNEVQYTVEDLGGEYLHVVTSAPAAYDYPYTISLFDSTVPNEFGKLERHVAVQKERKEYQFGRYSSGLNPYRVIE